MPDVPRFALVLLVAVCALAAGIGVGALLFGGDDDDTSPSAASAGAGPSTKPIDLPDSLGAFRDTLDVQEQKGQAKPALESAKAHQQRTKERTEAAYSQAYGGAAAAYRQYADQDLARLPWVIAVRAPAPGLTVGPAGDPEFLRLATPDHEIKVIGEVSCRIDWSPPALEGETPDPETENVTMCQRSSKGVTVWAGGSEFKGPDGLAALSDLTNSAWTAASG